MLFVRAESARIPAPAAAAAAQARKRRQREDAPERQPRRHAPEDREPRGGGREQRKAVPVRHGDQARQIRRRERRGQEQCAQQELRRRTARCAPAVRMSTSTPLSVSPAIV